MCLMYHHAQYPTNQIETSGSHCFLGEDRMPQLDRQAGNQSHQMDEEEGHDKPLLPTKISNM